MPALITNIIPQRGFELVREAIGTILLLELEEQKSLQNLPEEINIFQERMRPIQADEKLYLNILVDSNTNAGKTASGKQGTTIYFIDIHTTGTASDELSGDKDSGDRLHKFIGMIDYILSSDHYKTLGFAPGLIAGCQVESFATSEPIQKEDSGYTRMGRISFSVKIQDSQALATPVIFAGNDTTVKLQETNYGYKFVMENAA